MSKKRIISKVAAVIAAIIMCSSAGTVYAMDRGFVENPSKWHSSDYEIEKISLRNVNGYCQYLFDETDSAVYFHIEYSMNNLTENSDVKIGIEVENAVHKYDVTFDKGIKDGEIEEFDIQKSFGTIYADGQKIYFGIEFLNKTDKKLINNISIYLLVDNAVYPVYENMELDFETKEPDKVNSPSNNNKTTTAKKEKTTKEKTTKQKAEKEKSIATTKFKAPAVTKYKADISTSGKYKYEAENENKSDDTVTFGKGEAVTASSTGIHLSPQSLVLLIISIAMAIIGFALIIKPKNTVNNPDNEED